MSEAEAQTPTDRRALVAVDLGAESCRVSLLRWQSDNSPCITLVKRFENHARHAEGGSLRWNIHAIEQGVNDGIREAAALATEGIRAIAVDGWAVDYVRLNAEGKLLADPYCYRDERTLESEKAVHALLEPARLRELNGVQQLRLNTVYQLYADKLAGHEAQVWLNLPEYLLHRWGGRRVAEWTNAAHTGLVEAGRPRWSAEIFHTLSLDLEAAAKIVPPGTVVGRLTGELAQLPALRDTVLIAPACHDTASAIAGIAAHGKDWAYLSSGTWSLVGARLDAPCNSPQARAENFTNLGAAGGRILFHKNVNGMWLLRQSMESWAEQGHRWTIHDLVTEAEHVQCPEGLLEVDDKDLLLQGQMPQRINRQRRERGLPGLDESPANAPQFALLIFHSLAARYAEVLNKISTLTGRRFTRLYIVGGGSQNELLNRLTAQATGLTVLRGHCESSTIGNFAIQLAALEEQNHGGVSAEAVSRWAGILHPCR